MSSSITPIKKTFEQPTEHECVHDSEIALHQFKYGANSKIVGKTEPQNLSYAGAFSPVTGTFKDLAAHISAGHPWMPGESKETVMEIVQMVCDRGVES